MKLRAFCVASGLTLSSLTLVAQDGLRGPVSGLIVDEQTHAVRPIVGLPGSAYAGAASLGAADFAVAAPDGDAALVLRDGALSLVRHIAAAEPSWRTVRAEAAAVDRAVFSPDSGSVALVSHTNKSVEFLSGLNGDLRWRESVSLADISGTLASIVLARDAEYAFAAFQESDETATLYLLKSGEASRQLYTLSKAGALLLDRDALWVADAARNEIVRITNWNDGLQINTVATEALGVNRPVGLALSANGRTLFVANGEVRQLVAIDIAAQEVKSTLDLGFTPSRFDRSGSMFLLTTGVAGERPVQVFDPERMQVFFVPVSKDAVGKDDAKPAPAGAAQAE